MRDQWRQVGNEVLYTTRSLSTLTPEDIRTIKAVALASPRRRARLCTHAAAEDALHEMLIVVEQASYIRPHRHFHRPESLLVLEGRADAVFFTEDGAIDQVIQLAPYGTGGTFYYRIDSPQYHMLLLRSDWLVLVESSLGPFNPSASEFAAWSPPEQDAVAIEAFRQDIRRRLEAAAQNGRSSPALPQET